MYAEAVQLVCSEAPHLYHRVWRERRELAVASGCTPDQMPCALRVATVATLYGTCEIRRAEVIVLADRHREKTPISEAMRRKLLDLNDLSASLAVDNHNSSEGGKLFVCWITLTDAEEQCVMGQEVYVIDAARAELGPLWEGDVHSRKSSNSPNHHHRNAHPHQQSTLDSPNADIGPLPGMHIDPPSDARISLTLPISGLMVRERTSPSGLTDRSPSFGSRATTENVRRTSIGHSSSRGSQVPKPTAVRVQHQNGLLSSRQGTSPLNAQDNIDLVDMNERVFQVQNNSFVSSSQSARQTPTFTTQHHRDTRVLSLYQRNKRRATTTTTAAPPHEAPLPAASATTTEEWLRSGGTVDVQALAMSTSRAAAGASNQLVEAQGHLSQLSKLCSILDVERQEGSSLETLLSKVAATVHLVEQRLVDVEKLVRRQASMKDAGVECDFTTVSKSTIACQTDTVVFADELQQQQAATLSALIPSGLRRGQQHPSQHPQQQPQQPLLLPQHLQQQPSYQWEPPQQSISLQQDLLPQHPGTPRDSSRNGSPVNGSLYAQQHSSSVASTPLAASIPSRTNGQYNGPAAATTRSPLTGPISIPRLVAVGRASSSSAPLLHNNAYLDEAALTPRGVRPPQHHRRTNFEQPRALADVDLEGFIPRSAPLTAQHQQQHYYRSLHGDAPPSSHRHHHQDDLVSEVPVKDPISAWVHDVTGHLRHTPPDEFNESWRGQETELRIVTEAGTSGHRRGLHHASNDGKGGGHQLGSTSHFWNEANGANNTTSSTTAMSMGVFTAAWGSGGGGGDRRERSPRARDPASRGPTAAGDAGVNGASGGRSGLRDVPTGNMFRRR
ncbi:Hypothetical protein, putative [Bodo saltans]|uniref:Uncharacterized protein n=1 Tax=Bodo saltans TaxID=75058 RepID=A0A0S4J938_BODSA|nr:Hypothetical protein, putative [Bodo saltans]|eukprot:CUG87918.1 Hypothetical protein, putative [Bodo saltans]